MKTCWKCSATKSLECFGRDAKRHDGKNPMCKECVKQASAKYREEHPDRRKATCDRYRASNPDKCRAAYKSWYDRDRDETRAKKRSYEAANVEKGRARRAKWRSENHATVSRIKRDRAAAVGSHTASDISRLLTLQRGKCALCAVGLRLKGYHVDHILPLKLGGSNEATNIQLLCPPCNLSKGAKHPIEFAQQGGMLL